MKRVKNKGQSTIEFAFVLFAFISFLSLSYNAVVAFSVYQYLSYANFMAARAMQSSRATLDLQNNASLKVMKIYVPGITLNAQDTRFGFSRSRLLARITSWKKPEIGSTNLPFILVFKVPLLTLPIGNDLRREFGWITLKTSVILGREPTTQECHSFFQRFFVDMHGTTPHSPEAMEDNGC